MNNFSFRENRDQHFNIYNNQLILKNLKTQYNVFKDPKLTDDNQRIFTFYIPEDEENSKIFVDYVNNYEKKVKNELNKDIQKPYIKNHEKYPGFLIFNIKEDKSLKIVNKISYEYLDLSSKDKNLSKKGEFVTNSFLKNLKDDISIYYFTLECKLYYNNDDKSKSLNMSYSHMLITKPIIDFNIPYENSRSLVDEYFNEKGWNLKVNEKNTKEEDEVPF